MSIEVIDLLSSPELPKFTKFDEVSPIGLPRQEPLGRTQTSVPSKIGIPGVIYTERIPLGSVANLSKSCSHTRSRPGDEWHAISSDGALPSLTDLLTKPHSNAGNDTMLVQSTNAAKGGSEFYFLSDDFDSTIDLNDDPFSIDLPPTKKRRLSSSPTLVPTKAVASRSGLYQRSHSNIESTMKSKAAAGRTTSAPTLKRADPSLKALDLDPLIFTSSPDAFADVSRRRKERKVKLWDEIDDGHMINGKPGPSAKFRPLVNKTVNPRDPKRLDQVFEELSDLELSAMNALPYKKATKPSKPSSKESSKPTPSAFEEYLAEKEIEKNAKEKEKAKKEKAIAKELEKEKKREAREELAREKEKGAEIAKVNNLRTDKKISTPEMIVDLSSSLEEKVSDQIRTFLFGQQVETANWDCPMPIVKWRRKVEAIYNEKKGHFEPVAKHIRNEKRIMYIMSAEELVDLSTGDEAKNLDRHVLHLKAKFDSCEFLYLIQGYTAFIRKNRSLRNRQFTEAVRSHMDQADPSTTNQRRKKKEARYVDEDIVENALLKLQVVHGALIHHTASQIETSEWVVTFTQQISTIPYKIQKQSLDTAFCMESGQVKTGDGPEDTYVKMLQEIIRITAAVAYGIAADYPSVQKLVKGLEDEGPMALEDCRKSSNKDGGFTDRRGRTVDQ